MIQGTGRNKEGPSVQLLTQLRQTLQVEHLTDRYSPSRKTVVVHRPVVVPVWSHLEADSVTSDCYDMVVPHEPSDGLTLDKTTVSMFVCLCQFSIVHLLLQSDGLPGLGETTT